MWWWCSCLASSPGSPIFFNARERKEGEPGIQCHVRDVGPYTRGSRRVADRENCAWAGNVCTCHPAHTIQAGQSVDVGLSSSSSVSYRLPSLAFCCVVTLPILLDVRTLVIWTKPQNRISADQTLTSSSGLEQYDICILYYSLDLFCKLIILFLCVLCTIIYTSSNAKWKIKVYV